MRAYRELGPCQRGQAARAVCTQRYTLPGLQAEKQGGKKEGVTPHLFPFTFWFLACVCCWLNPIWGSWQGSPGDAVHCGQMPRHRTHKNGKVWIREMGRAMEKNWQSHSYVTFEQGLKEMK